MAGGWGRQVAYVTIWMTAATPQAGIGVGGFCKRQAGLSAKTKVPGNPSEEEERVAWAGAPVGEHRGGG